MHNKAKQVAIRLFFANADGIEDEVYSFLAECDEPDTTWVNDYTDGKPYQPWQPFEINSVSRILDLVDDLASDIVRTFTDEPEPVDEDSDDE